jgi:flagellar biosynthesis protein FliR
VATWGASVFETGLLIALPAVIALVIVNMALGVVTRAAPQLNLFGIGFPITLLAGF